MVDELRKRIEILEAEKSQLRMCVDDLKRQLAELQEELRVGNALTAQLTDKCRELELQLTTNPA